jgi:putative ABC transport system permease protein
MPFAMATRLLLGEAVRALLRHKSRSTLSAIGITIGVAAVVWVVALGRAGSERAEKLLRDLGNNLVWVEAGSRNVNGVRTGAHGTTTLTIDDAEAILHEVPLIQRMSPQVDGTVLLVAREHNWTTRSRGILPDYLDIKRWEIEAGAPFTLDDVSRAANVCLIGRTVSDRLFGGESPVGQIVRIGGQPFEVTGLLGAKGQSADGRDQDDTIFVPYTTALKKIRGGGGPPWVDDIMCSALTPEAINTASAQVTELLRQRHHIAPDAEDDFNIRRPEEVIKAQMETSKTFELLLSSVASVALLVGGIGVMNVMLASVAERTREIGVRLAVGATPSAVQLQFLAESVVLSSFGGVLGVLVSEIGSAALARLLGWPVSIPVQALVFAVAFSIGVGVFFGFYPAWKAAQLDPIEALRSE